MGDQKPTLTHYTGLEPDKKKHSPKPLAFTSLLIGIFSLVCFCLPPIQLVFGGLAIMFALLDRERANGKFENIALAGLILGVFSCVFSIVVFYQVLYRLELLKRDPQYISQLNKILSDWEQMFGITY